MTSLLSIHSLSKSHGTKILFKTISFTIYQGDRIGLIGPNGSGKTTLLKILYHLDVPDEGTLSRKQGLRIGYSSQSPIFTSSSLEDILLEQAPDLDPIEALTRARIILGKAQFSDFSQNAALLSGGWKKRLDLCRALMHEPDLLLLDEPTNHLDLEGILWLEKFLAREKIALLVVSHDRYFLEHLSNKIIELNACYPEGLFISQGNMTHFREHKKAFLKAQSEQQRSLTAIVKDEVAWLRRSPKARTTKSQSRMQKAYTLMEELSEVKKRNLEAKVDLNFSASDRKTRHLLVAKNLTKSLNAHTLFSGIDLKLSPGTRLGIVGKNGTGKTTLLKILAGILSQDAGTIKYADDLRLVYFDQHRELIPSHLSLRDALSPMGDFVNYRGQQIHVNGWAKKFLFSPDRLSLPVGALSGGEQARILIAKLMLEPADILFLDEPTNDLDISTLEIIENSLMEFAGALVLISHDRCLMDTVCTQILGLGANNEHQIFADYAQWERAQTSSATKTASKPPSPSTPVSRMKKLSYLEQKELDGMELSILQLETEILALQHQLENPLIQADQQHTLKLYNLLAEGQNKLEHLFLRWQFLHNKTLL